MKKTQSGSRLKPARIEQVVDGLLLRTQLRTVAQAEDEHARAQVRGVLHGALFRGRMIARERLEAGENGWAVARLLAAVADEIVGALYECAPAGSLRGRNGGEAAGFAVLAVGGYGRGELAPSSDLDLLFLRADKPPPFAQDATQYMLHMMWDLGLKVGHATRNVEECLKLARAEHTVQTALLEARCVAGDKVLAEELAQRFRKEVVARERERFIAAKLKERDARHQRVGASRYMVEPNVKEGKGGLRDLHTLFWLARHRYGFARPADYVEAGVFTQAERFALRRALRFLWTVRCHLHFITGRAEERLTFDLQPELAERLGYRARGHDTAVERFMKRYFLIAKEVGALTRVLCARLEADRAKRAPSSLQRLLPRVGRRPVRTARGFHVEAGRLNVDAPEVLDEPANLIRLFAVADRNDVDVHPAAMGEAARRARIMSPAWRCDEAARAAFLEVAASPRHPGAALRLMNEAGVLGRFVPEFGRIVGRTQFNMYHHYTVDEHTLRAIDAMSEIEHGRHRDRHPLSSEIFAKIINRRALYLAMLLHDTGKGEGDQQSEGERAARAACARLGLPQDECELVSWLVGHHLLMSDIAQKRDIGDASTVAQFAKTVGSVERLRLLLVLTVADIRAVGPTVWNDWKGQLLRDLYRLTEASLHGGRSDEEGVHAHLAELAAQAKRRLLHELGKAQSDPLAAWMGALEDGYWVSHDGEAQAWHARQVLAASAAGSARHVAARLRPVQGATEVLVYAADRPGLFASLAAAISASGADIAHARIHTTKDGMAFDVFAVQTADHAPFGAADPRALDLLLKRLERAAAADHARPAPAPTPRRHAAFAIDPWVRIDNEITPHATVIEASGRDRLGLLADLARVCAGAGASIVSAHIDTLGERASDVFYVQDQSGGQIADAVRIEALKAELEAALAAGEPAAPADPARTPLARGRASTAR